ncbi:CsbD family protein [Rhodococcus sp. DT1]|uniref:CsbD family protein n=1 Tax=Rhodococcus sp. DT1 TaxID=3416544 RepID=UPI003CE7D06F
MADFIDKAKHKAEELAGKAKEHGGKATNDRDLEAEGKGQQTKGGMKQAGDKVTDAAEDVKRSFKQD